MRFSFVTDPGVQPIENGISFPVCLMGKDLVATVTGLVNDPILNVFEISFSDGYKDRFTFSEDGHLTPGKQETGRAYAFIIKDDLECLCLLTPGEKVWNFRHDGISGNVWVRKQLRDNAWTYSVYTESDYHFHVVKMNGQWISQSRRKIDPRPIDEVLAARVIAIAEQDEAASMAIKRPLQSPPKWINFSEQ